jgi:hypothetical protein
VPSEERSTSASIVSGPVMEVLLFLKSGQADPLSPPRAHLPAPAGAPCSGRGVRFSLQRLAGMVIAAGG